MANSTGKYIQETTSILMQALTNLTMTMLKTAPFEMTTPESKPTLLDGRETTVINYFSNMTSTPTIASTRTISNVKDSEATLVDILADTIGVGGQLDGFTNNLPKDDVMTFGAGNQDTGFDATTSSYAAMCVLIGLVIMVSVILVIAIFCVRKRKKLRLEKSIMKVENPKYCDKPSTNLPNFDFLASKNIKAEFRKGQGDSTVTLESSNKKPLPGIPLVSVSDDISSRYSFYSSDRNDTKRNSTNSDFHSASVTAIKSDTASDISADRLSEASLSKKRSANHGASSINSFNNRQSDSPMKRRAPLPPADAEGVNDGPLLAPKSDRDNRFSRKILKLGDSENKSRHEDITKGEEEEDQDENVNSPSVALLKSKEKSCTSLDSYDRSLNPFFS